MGLVDVRNPVQPPIPNIATPLTLFMAPVAGVLLPSAEASAEAPHLLLNARQMEQTFTNHILVVALVD